MNRYHCCYNCKNRKIGCHSTCKMYLKEKEEDLKLKKQEKLRNLRTKVDYCDKQTSRHAKALNGKSRKRD